MDAVREAIRRMYPDGCMFFTRHGKRVEEPPLIPWRRGYKVNINGETHWFTSDGQFVGAGALAVPRVRGARRIPQSDQRGCFRGAGQ